MQRKHSAAPAIGFILGSASCAASRPDPLAYMDGDVGYASFEAAKGTSGGYGNSPEYARLHCGAPKFVELQPWQPDGIEVALAMRAESGSVPVTVDLLDAAGAAKGSVTAFVTANAPPDVTIANLKVSYSALGVAREQASKMRYYLRLTSGGTPCADVRISFDTPEPAMGY